MHTSIENSMFLRVHRRLRIQGGLSRAQAHQQLLEELAIEQSSIRMANLRFPVSMYMLRSMARRILRDRLKGLI